MTDRCQPVQPSIIQAFDASRESSPVQPDAGKQRLLAVSLLYTEDTQGDYGEPLLTVRRVAELLAVSTAAVYARCANGTLRHTRVGSAIRVAFSDLVEFVEEHSKGPASRRVSTFPLLPSHLDEGPVEATGPGGESEEFPTAGTEAGER